MKSVLKRKAAAAGAADYLETYLLTQEILGGSKSCFFTVRGDNVTSGSLTVPAYAKGAMIASSSSDAILIAVDASKNFYVSFRNNGTWAARRQL